MQVLFCALLFLQPRRPGRVWPLIPAQAVTFFYSATEKIPHSRAEFISNSCRACFSTISCAERCPGAFRADLAPDSRAGGCFFPFRAGKDTSFPRRTVTPVSFVL